MNDFGTRFARVLASAIWGWVAALLLQYLGLAFSAEQAEVINQGLVVFLAAVVNAGIALGSKRWPWLEWLLIVPVRPIYRSKKNGD